MRRRERAIAEGFVLHCFGHLRLTLDGSDCTPRSRKGRALLAILAAEQRPLTRVRIADLLWSDREEEQGRHSLRTLLTDLREQFGLAFDRLLVVDREKVALAPNVRTTLTDGAVARTPGELFEGLDHLDDELDEWLRTERGRRPALDASNEKPAATPRPATDQTETRRWPIAILLLLVLVTIGAAFYFKPVDPRQPPVLAVLKFKDLTGKNGLLAEGLAEELRIDLAQHPKLQMIGRESSEAASLQADDVIEAARQKLGVTHLVEGAVVLVDSAPVVSARLIEAESHRVLWSLTIRLDGGNLYVRANQIAAQLAGNVNETVGQGAGKAFEADAAAYADLFRARALIRTYDPDDAMAARQLLANVVARFPRFAPGLAALADATMRASDHPHASGPIPLAQARKEASAYARRAISAAPAFGPAHAALGAAYVEMPEALTHQKRAAELNPGSFEAHRRLARALENAGDLETSLLHHRRASALEPLSMPTASGLVRMLAITGRRDEVAKVLADFDRRSDSEADRLHLRAHSALDLGDLSTLYLINSRFLRLDPNDALDRRMQMWTLIGLGRRDEAQRLADNSLAKLILARDAAALERELRKIGQQFWTLDWERDDGADLLLQAGRGATLVALYDQRSGKLDPAFVPFGLVVALREAGRQQEASQLLREIRAFLVPKLRGQPPPQRALGLVPLQVLEGNIDGALTSLELAARDHWWNVTGFMFQLDELAVFRPLHDQPRFKAVMRGYYAEVARENAELAAQLLETRPKDRRAAG